jgi:ubiquinone biosynthesis monooxygenase Coq7
MTNTRTLPRHLPGDPPAGDDVARMLRVDLAGECGATRIYAGQLAVLGKSRSGDLIRHMADQEKVHRAAFEAMVADRRVRPTLLSPLWDIAGFALGAGTALLGEKAAMACTVAVEEVIDEHYREQVAALGEREPELVAKIEEFRADELEHRDTGLAHGAEQAPAYPVLAAVVKTGSRIAIWLSTRL